MGAGMALALALAAGFLTTRLGARAIARRWPARGRFVEVEGQRVHALTRVADGAERGVVALIHGASGNALDLMSALGEPLARRGYRVVALDRPGHGWSERGSAPDIASPARQARILRGALEAMGVSRATVVGHSWGATVAENLAIDHADFVEGLALLAPVALEWPGGVSWYYELASAPVIGRLFTDLVALPAGWLSLKGGVASVFAPQPAPPGFIEETGVALVLRPATFRANAQDVAWLKPYVRAQGPRLAEIVAPTVVVTGDRDGVVYTHIHSDGLMRLTPGARRVDLPGVGHSPHHVAPETVAEAIAAVAEAARVPAPAGMR